MEKLLMLEKYNGELPQEMDKLLELGGVGRKTANVVIAAKSGVTGNVADNQMLSGYPLMDHKEDLKVRVSWKKLPELLKRVRAIEKKLEEK